MILAILAFGILMITLGQHYRNVNDGDIQLCEVLGTALATDESLFYFYFFLF